MGNYLSRDEILASPVKTTDVNAFGGKVCVREMDALTMQELMESGAFVTNAKTGESELNFGKVNLALLVARHVVDPETLEPLFTEKDVKELQKKSFGDVTVVVAATLSVSGLSMDEATKNAEDTEKN